MPETITCLDTTGQRTRCIDVPAPRVSLTKLHTDSLGSRQLVVAQRAQTNPSSSVLLSGPRQSRLDRVGSVEVDDTALQLLDKVLKGGKRVWVGG